MTEAERRRALLVAAGPALLETTDWQRPLCRLLGPLHPAGPRPALDDSLLRKWLRGARPVPDWVAGAIASLLRDRLASLEAEAARRRAAIDDALRMAEDCAATPVEQEKTR